MPWNINPMGDFTTINGGSDTERFYLESSATADTAGADYVVRNTVIRHKVDLSNLTGKAYHLDVDRTAGTFTIPKDCGGKVGFQSGVLFDAAYTTPQAINMKYQCRLVNTATGDLLQLSSEKNYPVSAGLKPTGLTISASGTLSEFPAGTYEFHIGFRLDIDLGDAAPTVTFQRGKNTAIELDLETMLPLAPIA